jgi:hypothetical protein
MRPERFRFWATTEWDAVMEDETEDEDNTDEVGDTGVKMEDEDNTDEVGDAEVKMEDEDNADEVGDAEDDRDTGL